MIAEEITMTFGFVDAPVVAPPEAAAEAPATAAAPASPTPPAPLHAAINA